MADQQSAMKEFRSLDQKRTREGLTPQEEMRYSRLRDLVGPEGGAAAPKAGFDINAAAARLRDSLMPAGLRNRPPPVPPPAPEPEVAPALEPDPLEAAGPRPWDPNTPPHDPSALPWDAAAAAPAPDLQGWDPAAQPEWDPNAAPADAGQPIDPDAPAWDAASAPDQQGWDPAAQPEWDPNAAPADAGQAFDPDAPAWDAAAAAPDQQGWDPAAQPEWDPNAAPADGGQPIDPDAPAWDAAAAAPDQQGWDPAAQPEWDPNAAPADPGQAFDPDAPAWDAAAAAPDQQEWDPAARPAWDPNAPFDAGAALEASALVPDVAADPAVTEGTAAFEAQPFEAGPQDLDPDAVPAEGAPADLLAAAASDGGWAGETEPLGEPMASPEPFEGATDSFAAADGGAGFAEELGGAGGDFGAEPAFAQEASAEDVAELDPSGFQAVQAIEPAASDTWKPDPADIEAGFSLESGGSFDAAASAAAPEWAAGAPAAPWADQSSEAQPDGPAPTQPLSDILEPLEPDAPSGSPSDDLGAGQSLSDLLEPEPEAAAAVAPPIDLAPGQSLSDLLEPAEAEAAPAEPLQDDLSQGGPLADLLDPAAAAAAPPEPLQDDLSQGGLAGLLEPAEAAAAPAEPPAEDFSKEPSPGMPLADLADLAEPAYTEAPKAAPIAIAPTFSPAEVPAAVSQRTDVLDARSDAWAPEPSPEAPHEPELAAAESHAPADDFAVDFEEAPGPAANAPELDFSRPDLSAGFEEESFDISFDDDSPAPPEGAPADAAAPLPEGAALSPDAEPPAPAPSAAPEAAAVDDEVPTIEGEEIVDEPSRGGALPQLEIEDPTPSPTAIASAVPAAPAPTLALAVDLHIAGVKRVVVHTVEGQVKRGVLENADLDASVLRLAANPGAPSEPIAREKVKAIFFMLETGEKAPAAQGKRVRVTFNDGRQVAGFSQDYREEGVGFFMSPGDARTNTGRIWVYRAAVRQVFVS